MHTLGPFALAAYLSATLALAYPNTLPSRQAASPSPQAEDSCGPVGCAGTGPATPITFNIWTAEHAGECDDQSPADPSTYTTRENVQYDTPGGRHHELCPAEAGDCTIATVAFDRDLAAGEQIWFLGPDGQALDAILGPTGPESGGGTYAGRCQDLVGPVRSFYLVKKY